MACAAKPQPVTREQVDAMIQKVADTTGRKDYNWKRGERSWVVVSGFKDSRVFYRKAIFGKAAQPLTGDKDSPIYIEGVKITVRD